MKDKELIKQEIEKRLSSLWDLIPEGEKILKDDFTKEDANNLGRYTELENLLKFINSLPEEHNEDLEEEIKCYIKKEFPDGMGFPNVPKIARHFTEWQKQQMMKDAVGGVVHHFADDELAAVHYNDPKCTPMSIYVSSKGLSAGDKVKIIIVKEEQK